MRNAALSLFALFLSTVCLAAGHEVTTPIYLPATVSQLGWSVATNGSTFLVVFRQGPTIYASFAAADGTPINSLPIPLLGTATIGTFQITSINGKYVLYWTDGEVGYLADVGSDGSISNKRPVAAPPLVAPMIAVHDSTLFIVGQNSDPGPSHDDAEIVLSDGSLVAQSIHVSDTYDLREAIAVGDTFVVTTTEPTGIFIQRFSRDGALLPPGRLKLSSDKAFAGHAVAATDSNQIVVVWSEHSDAAQDMFLTAALTSDLHIIERHSTTVADKPFISDTSVVWNGTQYVATAIVGDRAGISKTTAMHLDRSGAVSDLTDPFDAILQRLSSVGGAAYGVGLDSHGVVTTWTLDSATLTLRRLQPLSYSLPWQRFPSVASDGVDFAGVFREESATSTISKIALFTRNGVPKTEGGILVTESPGATARIAYGDSTYLVVWGNGGEIYARRFSAQGFAIDPQPVAIASADSWGPDPIAIWNGRAFFVVWSRNSEFYGTFVGSDGVVSPEHHLAYYGIQPSIAGNGRIFLLVFGVPLSSGLEGPPLYGDVEGLRIAADGSPLDANPIVLMHQDRTILEATVASDGHDFMVAVDRSTGVAVFSVTSSDENTVAVGAAKKVFDWFLGTVSEITYDGQQYFLGWRYQGIGTSWIASGHLQSDGALQVNGAEQILPAVDWTLSVASNHAGDNVIMVSEATPDTFTPRTHAYFDGELSPPPPLPQAPAHVTATGTRPNVIVRWDATADAEGVLIDAPNDASLYPLAVRKASDGVTTLQYPPSVIRIRTFNASGLSQPVILPVMLVARRRASR